MDPAFKVPLDEKQLALVGELTAILGQIDEVMIRTIERLLSVDRAAANYILGSSKIADNSGIWAQVIRNRTNDADTTWLVAHALTEMEGVSKGRNDFVHAWFDHVRTGHAR